MGGAKIGGGVARDRFALSVNVTFCIILKSNENVYSHITDNFIKRNQVRFFLYYTERL
jgi:hypothetical protein